MDSSANKLKTKHVKKSEIEIEGKVVGNKVLRWVRVQSSTAVQEQQSSSTGESKHTLTTCSSPKAQLNLCNKKKRDMTSI